MDESLKSEEEQDLRLQEHLFITFYASVRLNINTNGTKASDVQKEWPLLFTQHHFLAHFERLTGTRLRGLFSESSVEDHELLHAFFRHHVKTEESLQWLLQTDRAAREQSRPRALLIGLFPLMCLFFKEKIASLFCVVEETCRHEPRRGHPAVISKNHYHSPQSPDRSRKIGDIPEQVVRLCSPVLKSSTLSFAQPFYFFTSFIPLVS